MTTKMKSKNLWAVEIEVFSLGRYEGTDVVHVVATSKQEAEEIVTAFYKRTPCEDGDSTTITGNTHRCRWIR